MPLPHQPYELARFNTLKVHIDYHFEIDGHRYSAPHPLVGQTLEARMIGYGRSDKRGGFSTVEAHMPVAHRTHMAWTQQRLIEWGQRIGVRLRRVDHPSAADLQAS